MAFAEAAARLQHPGSPPVELEPGLHILIARRPARHDLIDEAERLRFLRRHEFIALDRRGDGVEVLAGMLNVDLVEALPKLENLARLNLDVRRLALGAARRLVDHDPRI